MSQIHVAMWDTSKRACLEIHFVGWDILSGKRLCGLAELVTCLGSRAFGYV